MPTPIKTHESFIHDRVLQDLITAHLYATSALPETEEVLDMTISTPDHAGLRTLQYQTIKMKEVELIVHS